MMAAGHLDAVRAMVRHGRLRQGDPDPRGRRHPQRHHPAGARRASPDDCPVLFHDAVRPLVSERIITECFEALESLRRGRRRDPVRRHDHRGRPDRQHDPGDPAAREPAARPDSAGVPLPPCSARRTTKAGEDPGFTATDDCGVVLRYLPDVPIWVVSGEERNMKVTDPIDVFLADKLFQLTSSYVPEGHDRRGVPRGPRRQGRGRARRQLRHRRRHRGAGQGARRDRRDVQPVQHRTPTSSGAPTSSRSPSRWPRSTGGSTTSSHTAGILPRGSLLETTEETIYAATEVNYLGAGVHRPGLLPPPAPHRRQPAAVHLEQLHPRAERLQPLLLGEGGGGQPHPGAGRRVGRERRPGQLRQPRAHRHADADARRSARSRPAPCSTRELVAKASLDVLLSEGTGHVLDLRKLDPLAETCRRERSSGERLEKRGRVGLTGSAPGQHPVESARGACRR